MGICMFHIRNDVPLVEWSIEAPNTVSKINFSGRMGAVPTHAHTARCVGKADKSTSHNKKLHSLRQAKAFVDLPVGVFPRTRSFLFYSRKVAPIITIHKLMFLIWNKTEQTESRSEGRVRDV